MYLFGSITSGIMLATYVSSEQLDSWGDMGAIGILGALCFGFGVLHWKTQQGWVRAFGELRDEIRKQNTSMNKLLGKLIDRE